MKTHYIAFLGAAVLIGISALNAQESKPVSADQSPALAKTIAQLAEAITLSRETAPAAQKRARLLFQQAKGTAQEALRQHKQLPEKEKKKVPLTVLCGICKWLKSKDCQKELGCK